MAIRHFTIGSRFKSDRGMLVITNFKAEWDYSTQAFVPKISYTINDVPHISKLADFIILIELLNTETN